MSGRDSPGKPGRWLRVVATGAVLLAFGGYLVMQVESEEEGPYRCVVEGGKDQEPYELEPGMVRNAATIEAVGAARGLPERAVTIALATAMQESMLRNIDYGDRDSVGLFQQRPSQGWGTVEQIMDPVYSAGKFYERLLEISDYEELPLTEAAQEVQRSGFPDEYAKHETEADLLAAALTGRRAGALNCSGKRSGEPAVGDSGKASEKLVAEFGQDVLPRAESGQSAKKASLTIPVRANAAGAAEGDSAKGGDPQRASAQRGWQLAHWSLANASHLGVERIAYGKHVWDAENAGDGWQESESTESAGVTLTFARP